MPIAGIVALAQFWAFKAPIQEALYSSAIGKVTKLRHGHNALQPEEDGSGPIKGTTPTRFRQPLAVCRSSPLVHSGAWIVFRSAGERGYAKYNKE